MKAASEQSLRFLVEKWLAPAPSAALHVTEFSRIRQSGRRYVRVETSSNEAGSRALFFFRHDDGRWCVFPPTGDAQRWFAHPRAA